ncbi:MAG: hypothetical protein ACHWZW_16285 [Spirulina sp.]
MKGTWFTGFATIAIALLRDGLRQLARVADLRITGPTMIPTISPMVIKRADLGARLGISGGAFLKVWLKVQFLGLRSLKAQSLGLQSLGVRSIKVQFLGLQSLGIRSLNVQFLGLRSPMVQALRVQTLGHRSQIDATSRLLDSQRGRLDRHDVLGHYASLCLG